MIISEAIQQYAEANTTPVDENLQALERQTYLTTLQPHMVSGSYQGKLLEMISCLLQPKTILEIGTFTGFSALCLVKGLQVGGTLHTIDVNHELMDKTKAVFDESIYAEQIQLHIGDAMDVVPKLDTKFDLVFIDGDKGNYINYYEMLVEKVNRRGVILVDNVLWKGKVLQPNKDKKTQAIHVLNKRVQEDDRVENLLLPVRDGLMWIVKK